MHYKSEEMMQMSKIKLITSTVINSVLTHIFHWLVCWAKSARSRAIVLDLSAGWAKVGPEGCGAGCVEVVTCWGSRAKATSYWTTASDFL